MIFLKLLRVKDWVKNLFILLPLFFSGDLFDFGKLNQTLFVVISFCLVTSFVYILNDIFDIEFDKNHLEKKLRPIPSGKVSVRTSLFIGILFLLIGLTLLWYSSIESFYLTVFYVLLNIFYSYKLKQVPIIDFIIVSVGFVIRVLNNYNLSSYDEIHVFGNSKGDKAILELGTHKYFKYFK